MAESESTQSPLPGKNTPHGLCVVWVVSGRGARPSGGSRQRDGLQMGGRLMSLRFQIVPTCETSFKRRWTIEEVIPGEQPVPIPFFGTRAEVEAEASRLNLYGRKAPAVPPATKRLPEIPMTHYTRPLEAGLAEPDPTHAAPERAQ